MDRGNGNNNGYYPKNTYTLISIIIENKKNQGQSFAFNHFIHGNISLLNTITETTPMIKEQAKAAKPYSSTKKPL